MSARPLVAKTIILKTFLDEGVPGPEHFSIEEKVFPLESLKEKLTTGQMIVQIKYISVDPFQRGFMKSMRPANPAKPGNPMVGFTAGKVLASKNTNYVEGDLFGSFLPLSTYQVLNEEQSTPASMFKLTNLIDEEHLSYGVGILGMPGSTAYGGFIDVLKPKKGETIFISAASGAVGSLVGMMAKQLFDCKVIGSCGGPEKCDFIKKHFGFDHAIDYKQCQTKDQLVAKLREVAPEGIDMYFENVGGIHFEASLACLRTGGRIAICGWISEYNAAGMPAATIHPLSMLYTHQRIEGFVCTPYLYGQIGNFHGDMSTWLNEGKVKAHETFSHGIENWAVAFQSMFTGGAQVGKVVIGV